MKYDNFKRFTKREVQMNINQNPEQIYIPDTEVAKILNSGVQSLRNNRSKGVGLPYSKFGRLVRYKLADVLAYLEARKITPTE
jgi:hypothetical protein